MKKNFTLILACLFSGFSVAQTTVFMDDFESGTSAWTLTGTWGLTTSQSVSPSNSLTDSPSGAYANQTTSTATMSSGVNLSSAVSADLSFNAIYDLEANFDYVYVEVSPNNGTSWTTLATFTGDTALTPWVAYTYSLGGYVGLSSVKIRFRFVSDQAVTADGIYIDDVTIVSYATDIAPPLIQHTPPVHYESTLGSQSMNATLTDISGISQATLYYKVDGGSITAVSGINTLGNNYVFVIPTQNPGAWVDYYIKAVDNSTALNADSTAWYSYIQGNYIKYDNAQVDFVNSFGPAAQSGLSGAAVKVTLPGTTNLVTALIRNYTDPTRPNDSMEVHIWSDNAGIPGTDLVTPFMVKPEATLSKPNLMTRIDLRPYASQLAGLSGNIFIGFIVPNGEVWTQQTTPGSGGRTYVKQSSAWVQITDDYHFRAITGQTLGAPVADFSYDTLSDPTVDFTDLSTNFPNAWLWDFDDNGATSTVQNPTHTFSTNRTYNVCLTATNGSGNSSVCKLITVAQVLPVASFTYNTINDPSVVFTDTSPDTASSWFWDFDDGQTSTQQNPLHTFTANGSYNVCLSITNSVGTSLPFCDTVTITHVGMAENANDGKLNVFPVPYNGSATVTASGEIENVVVLDAIGREVNLDIVYRNSEISLAGKLPQGYYLVKVFYRNGKIALTRFVAN